jgi:anti-sigma factor RsiW
MQLKTFLNTLLDCDQVQARFSEYLDGMLSAEERRTIHEHLQFCDTCSEHLDGLCKTLSMLADFREECLPDSIRNFRLPRSSFVEIFPTIQEEKPPRTWGVVIPFVYAFLFLFLLVSGWEFAYRHTSDEFYHASNWVEVVARM